MSTNAKFLKLARDRWKQAEEADASQRKREIEDLRFYAGEQWDADILRSRQGQTLGSGTNQQIVPARPTLTINKTREPVAQVLNQERQSDMTIELIPADDFGEMAGPIDATEIELREGLLRRIQRDSEAADARTWAFNRATIAGRGYWRINTRYVSGKTMDQEIYDERIYNQASVLLEPGHEQPDGSDADWGFIGQNLPIAVYKSKYPHRRDKPNRVSLAQTDQEWRALGDEAPDWFTGEGETRAARVVTYYYTERETRELCQLADGSVQWRDELPSGTPEAAIQTSRSVETKQIKWADLDGVQVLDSDEWPGHYLPIIKVLGEELQPYDKERRSEGIVRPMREPCMGNNYIVSKFVEQVGLTPIPPWMGPAGFDEGFEAEYDAANTRALSRLHYNTKDFNNQPIPPGAVTRTPVSTDVQHLALGVQLFQQAIVSTSKVPETALGNVDPSVKSGKLAKALIQQAEQGTSNFMDNLKRSMRHEARVINDLLYPIYGTRPGRLARMMNKQGEMSAVVIGQPFTMQGQGAQAKPMPVQPGQPTPPEAKQYQLTPDAEFNVAIKIAKNEGTRREQEVQTLGEMITADPTLMQVLGDLFFKYQDGPGHQEMSDRMKAVLIPPVQALVSGGAPPVPPQVQQQMQQMQEQMGQLQQDADKNRAAILQTQMDNQTKETIAAAEQAGKERLAWISASAALATAGMKVDAENARSFVDALEQKGAAALEAHLQLVKHAQERIAQASDQTHEGQVLALEHAHETHLAQLGHQQALEQGQQAAELAPEPSSNGAGA